MPFELVKINRVGSRRALGARPWREERAAERVALTAIRSSRQGLLPEAAAGTLGTATQPLRCLGVLAFHFSESPVRHRSPSPSRTAAVPSVITTNLPSPCDGLVSLCLGG